MAKVGWFESDSFEYTICLYNPECALFEGEYMSCSLAEKEAYACNLCVCRESEGEFSENWMIQ